VTIADKLNYINNFLVELDRTGIVDKDKVIQAGLYVTEIGLALVGTGLLRREEA